MPGGEGSPINLLDRHHHHRASATAAAATTSSASRIAAAAAAADECANDDDVGTTATASTTGATLGSGSAMTSALAGDGLRRRKVIHAAKETLDKGECSRGCPLLRSFVYTRYPGDISAFLVLDRYETSRNLVIAVAVYPPGFGYV